MTARIERELRRFLRDAYGVRKVATVTSAKHPALTFEYDGKPRIVSFTRSAPSDGDVFHIMKGNVRRDLGPAPVPAKKEKRVMADLMPTAAPAPRAAPAEYAGKLAFYKDKRRVGFAVPPRGVRGVRLRGLRTRSPYRDRPLGRRAVERP